METQFSIIEYLLHARYNSKLRKSLSFRTLHLFRKTEKQVKTTEVPKDVILNTNKCSEENIIRLKDCGQRVGRLVGERLFMQSLSKICKSPACMAQCKSIDL